MNFDELMALPTGAVVIWTFPNEEWPDVKSSDGFRATTALGVQRWLKHGHTARVVWQPNN